MYCKALSKNRFARGFTLIELLIVVILIGIVAAYAVPSFSQMVASNQVSSTTNGVVGTLNYARSEAVKAGRTVNVRALDGASWDSGLLVWLDGNANNTFDAAEELRRYEDFDGSITLATTSGLTQFGFRGNGYLTPAAAAELELSVASPNTAFDRFVCVGFSGRVRTAEVTCP